jgi:hypothetical protein
MDEHGIGAVVGTLITFIVVVGIGPLIDYIKHRYKKNNYSPEGTDKQLSKINNTYIISRGKEKKQI